MKKLFVIILCLLAIQASAQTALTSNPSTIALATTSTQYVDLPPNASFVTTVLVRTSSTNAGTVQFSTYSSTVTSSPAYAADRYIWLTVTDRRLWIKLSNSADTVEISW